MLQKSFCIILGAAVAFAAPACSSSDSNMGTGGSSGMGGSAAGGAGGTGGSSATDGSAGAAITTDGGSASMTFFVTSVGHPNGGNLGGLAGADAFCASLAVAVSSAAGAKTWHAYLSTDTVNARDRIGPGPWANAAGRVIANTLAQLHDQAMGGMLDPTWPIGDASIALDEKGAPVPTSPNRHDILTGSAMDGTVMAGMTCQNWTSAATTDMVEVGHSNRTGGGRPPSFSTAHGAGCAPGPDANANNVAGTVTQGGGRGSIYCFALP